MSSSSAEKQT